MRSMQQIHQRAMGQTVRGAMVQSGFTQDGFGREFPMPPSTLSRRLKGVLPFTYPELIRVSEITGVSVAELVATAERLANRELVDVA